MVKHLFRSRLIRATVIVASAMLASPTLAFAAEGPAVDRPTVEVSGTGKASATADMARLSLTVETTAPDAATAMADNAAATRRVTDALIAAEVAAVDIQTGGLSLNAVYDYPINPNLIVGYRAVQLLEVVLRDLTEAGAALDAAARNGAQINGIAFEVSDNEALLAAARESAVAGALTKAYHYAWLTGNAVGRVLSIVEQSATPLTTLDAAIPVAGAPSPPTPIRPADVEVFVTVDIVCELVPNSQAHGPRAAP